MTKAELAQAMADRESRYDYLATFQQLGVINLDNPTTIIFTHIVAPDTLREWLILPVVKDKLAMDIPLFSINVLAVSFFAIIIYLLLKKIYEEVIEPNLQFTQDDLTDMCEQIEIYLMEREYDSRLLYPTSVFLTYLLYYTAVSIDILTNP